VCAQLTQQMERIQALTAQLRPPPATLPASQEALLQARIAHLEQQLAARPASAGPLGEGADVAPEPRRARPSLPPSSPSTAEDLAGSSQRGGPGGPQVGGRSYNTLIGKGAARRSPHRLTTRVPSEGESGRAASQEAPSAELVARAEAAERAAKRLEAQVEQLHAKLQAEPQERGTGAGKAEAEEALLRVEVSPRRLRRGRTQPGGDSTKVIKAITAYLATATNQAKRLKSFTGGLGKDDMSPTNVPKRNRL
jgi:hypothetical protein